jgi:hypothetical protein
MESYFEQEPEGNKCSDIFLKKIREEYQENLKSLEELKEWEKKEEYWEERITQLKQEGLTIQDKELEEAYKKQREVSHEIYDMYRGY